MPRGLENFVFQPPTSTVNSVKSTLQPSFFNPSTVQRSSQGHLCGRQQIVHSSLHLLHGGQMPRVKDVANSLQKLNTFIFIYHVLLLLACPTCARKVGVFFTYQYIERRHRISAGLGFSDGRAENSPDLSVAWKKTEERDRKSREQKRLTSSTKDSPP